MRIDDRGLEIEPRRGLRKLFGSRARIRINTSDLREVSRAADALRIEFGMPGARRAVLPFWVKDPDTAAEIMRLVPTDRTIERDEPITNRATARRRHFTLAFVIVGLASLVTGVVGTAIVGSWRDTAASREPSLESSSESTAGTSPSPATVAGPPVPRIAVAAALPSVGAPASRPDMRASAAESDPTEPREEQVEYGPGAASPGAYRSGEEAYVDADTAAQVAADSAIRRFMRKALALRSEYVYGNTPPGDLENRWWALSEQLYNSPAFDSWPKNLSVDRELGLSLNWRASLANYRDALRSGDRGRIEAARADLATADALTDEVNRFID